MRPILLALLAVCMIPAAITSADEPAEPKSLEARQARINYESALDRAERAHQQATAAARREYRKSLETAQTKATKRGELDEALAIKAELEAVGSERSLQFIPMDATKSMIIETRWLRFHAGVRKSDIIEFDDDGTMSAIEGAIGTRGIPPRWRISDGQVELLQGSGRTKLNYGTVPIIADTKGRWIFVPAP